MNKFAYNLREKGLLIKFVSFFCNNVIEIGKINSISRSSRIKLRKGKKTMKGKVVSILRGYTYEQVKAVCNALVQGDKVKNVEITMNTPNALEIIKKITEEFNDRLSVGAGTVVTFDELKAVTEYDVKFVLAPVSYTKEMIDYCHSKNVLAIPAAYTPTEIYTQLCYGADVVKVFPANELSKSYANKVKETLKNCTLMAVGGVNASNVNEHFAGGYQYVGTANGIFKKADILSENVEGLLKSLKEFEANLPEE